MTVIFHRQPSSSAVLSDVRTDGDIIYFALYRVVADNLKTVDSDRKCYRMVGGVLIERTVKDVLPDLITNTDQVRSVTYCCLSATLTIIVEYKLCTL